MAQLGNKLNAYINGEWGKHVKKWMKQKTSRIRRQMEKRKIKED